MIVTKLHVWVHPMVLSQAERDKVIDRKVPVEIVYEPDEFDGHYYENDTHDLIVWKDEREVSRIVRGMYARADLRAHDSASPDEKLGGDQTDAELEMASPVEPESQHHDYEPQPILEMLRNNINREVVPQSPYERFRYPLGDGKFSFPEGTGEVLRRQTVDDSTQPLPVVPPDKDATQILDISRPNCGEPRGLFQYWPGVGRHRSDAVWLRIW